MSSCSATPDDVLVFTKSPKVEDHIADLERVFIQLDKYGLKIKASKMKVALTSMPFLGVVITKDGMIPNKEKTSAIENLDYPNKRTVKCFRDVCVLSALHCEV